MQLKMALKRRISICVLAVKRRYAESSEGVSTDSVLQ
jgi:hypothetical protein